MPRKGDIKNISGARFGRLTAVEFTGRLANRSALWLCRCDCGGSVVASQSNLKTSNTASCGCLRVENNKKTWTRHGHCRPGQKTPEYESWAAMWSRCRARDPSDMRAIDYGLRGVSVCDSWRSFEAFFADMGPRPEGTSIDRKDVNGNYEPSNCRWATLSEQQINKRSKEQLQEDRKRVGSTDAI